MLIPPSIGIYIRLVQPHTQYKDAPLLRAWLSADDHSKVTPSCVSVCVLTISHFEREVLLSKKVNFEIYIANRKATTCI